MKRFIISALAIIMLLPCLYACADNDKKSDGNSQNSDGGDTTTSVTDGTTGYVDEIYKDVPDERYEGYKFKILNQISGWAMTTLEAEQSGDVIDDAVAKRNSDLEAKLGIEINVTDTSSPVPMFEAAYTTGDYDCLFAAPGNVMSLALKGMVTNTNNIESMSTDKEWWYPIATDSINFGDTRYLLYSDIHLHFHESFYVVAVNKALLEHYTQFQNPYDLIDSNEWTVEKMFEMIEIASDDKNTDESSRTYGIAAALNTGYSFMVGLGANVLRTNSNGNPIFTKVDEKYIKVYELVTTTLYNDKVSTNADQNKVFSEGRSLFLFEVTGTLKQHRNDEIQYGIVYTPKYNQSQADYISPLTVSAEALGVNSVKNEDELYQIGAILENMNAESHRTLKPAYYDILLHLKYSKDEKSIEILEHVYQTGRFDIAYLYNFGKVKDIVNQAMIDDVTSIASYVDRMADAMNSDIQTYYKKLNLEY